MRNAQLIRVDTGALPSPALGCIPHVGVLLSTYNGEKYLCDQIDSIAAQESVSVEVFVRDDGSTDGTLAILEELMQRPRGCICAWHLERGCNLGFMGSFGRLLAVADGCEWYSFSDQDDVWLPSKLATAIGLMKDTAQPSLYASSVLTVDETLSPLGKNAFPGFVYSIQSEFVRHRLAGHTMVWNKELHHLLLDYADLPCWSHDQFVTLVAVLTGASLNLDEESYVLHRRLSSSITPGGAGIGKRIVHEMRLLWNPERAWDRAELAERILSIPEIELGEAEARFLWACANHKRVSLVRDPTFNCGIPAGNAEGKLSVLLGRF